MVAYSFKPSFAAKILTGAKRQTIRTPRGGRGRHARPEEALQLYTGMRTKTCRKLGDARCIEVREVVLDFSLDEVTLDDAIVIDGIGELDAFAILDGFGEPPGVLTSWAYMRRWWQHTHPGQDLFRGVLIGWGDTFRAPGP